MVDLICPKGMVLISGGNKDFPDEPPFCIHITEVPQEDDNRFWAKKMQESGYQEVTRDKLSGGKDGGREPLGRVEAEKAIDRNKEQLKIKMEYKPQPTGNSLGPRKPAVLRNWYEAREYCQESFQGGDLPTVTQWYVACGEGTSTKACTASGELKKTEARIEESFDAGPVDVDSYPPNANGVKNMVGNVWEWVAANYDVDEDGRIALGDSWTLRTSNAINGNFKLGSVKFFLSFYRNTPDGDPEIGYRCIAAPKPPK